MKPMIRDLKLDDDGDYRFDLWVQYDKTEGDPHNRTVIWRMDAFPTGPRFMRSGLILGAPHLIQGDWEDKIPDDVPIKDLLQKQINRVFG